MPKHSICACNICGNIHDAARPSNPLRVRVDLLEQSTEMSEAREREAVRRSRVLVEALDGIFTALASADCITHSDHVVEALNLASKALNDGGVKVLLEEVK